MAQIPLPRVVPQPGLAPQQRPPPGAPRMMGLQSPPQGVMVSMVTPVMATPLPPTPGQMPPTTVSVSAEVGHGGVDVSASQQAPPQSPYQHQHQTTHHAQSYSHHHHQMPHSHSHNHAHPHHHSHPQYPYQPQMQGANPSSNQHPGGRRQQPMQQYNSSQQSQYQPPPQPYQSQASAPQYSQQYQSTQGYQQQPNQYSQPLPPQPPQQQQYQQPPQTSSATASNQSQQNISVQQNGQPISDNSLSGNACAGKEKTPMCLINELARYNKIQHQYRLTQETGPAHKRTFTVTLKLGEEEYTASGPSIKKAQHAAAGGALDKTAYKRPPPKLHSSGRSGGRSNITPTVELNALAMKRGELAVYTFSEPTRPGPYFPTNFGFRGMYNQVPGYLPFYPYDRRTFQRMGDSYGHPMGMQRYTYYKQGANGGSVFRVSLRVGQREFLGEGPTPQAARHNAAGQALRVLKEMPLPENVKGGGGGVPSSSAVLNSGRSSVSNVISNGTVHSENGDCDGADPDADLKSPISLVHEIALKHNLTVNFEVTRESGPPHMRTFVTQCIVGDFITEGEGNGKKVSKKRAAEKMLDKLKVLPSLPPSPVAKIKKKPAATKKKSRNLIKEQAPSADYPQGINPISRLIQIQQAKKEKEPVYTLVAERGLPRRREFVMQVSVGSYSATGSGPNKKLAKRAAAEALLQIMGYSQPSASIGQKPSIKGEAGTDATDKGRKVTFIEENSKDKNSETTGNSSLGLGTTITAGSGGGRQLVPGLLLMPDGHSHGHSLQGYSGQTGSTLVNSSGVNQQGSHVTGPISLVSLQTTGTIAKELLKGGTSPTADALLKSGQISSTSSGQSSTTSSSALTSTTCTTPPVGPVMTSPNIASTLPAPSIPPSDRFVRPKEQLLYLAQVLNFNVQFTDFPKGNRSEFLSLVSLSTDPPQVSHGAGPTIDASHDSAALTALHSLAEYGLDSVTSTKKENGPVMMSGESLHLNGQKVPSSATSTIQASGH